MIYGFIYIILIREFSKNGEYIIKIGFTKQSCVFLRLNTYSYGSELIFYFYVFNPKELEKLILNRLYLEFTNEELKYFRTNYGNEYFKIDVNKIYGIVYNVVKNNIVNNFNLLSDIKNNKFKKISIYFNEYINKELYYIFIRQNIEFNYNNRINFISNIINSVITNNITNIKDLYKYYLIKNNNIMDNIYNKIVDNYNKNNIINNNEYFNKIITNNNYNEEEYKLNIHDFLNKSYDYSHLNIHNLNDNFFEYSNFLQNLLKNKINQNLYFTGNNYCVYYGDNMLNRTKNIMIVAFIIHKLKITLESIMNQLNEEKQNEKRHLKKYYNELYNQYKLNLCYKYYNFSDKDFNDETKDNIRDKFIKETIDIYNIYLDSTKKNFIKLNLNKETIMYNKLNFESY